MKTLSAMIAGLLLSAGIAHAKDGRFARAAVVKNLRDKGLSAGDIRVTAIKDSRSGKSVQVLAETRASGTVRAFNVDKSTGVARQTPTGLIAQGSAAGVANQDFRREPGARSNKKQPGSYAGVNRGGLSARGKSFVFSSATDRKSDHPGSIEIDNKERTFVSVKNGKKFHYDNNR